MKTSDELKSFFQTLIGPGRRFPTRADMAAFLGIPKTQVTKLHNFLDGRDTQYRSVLSWFAQLGGSLATPAGDASRDVCFVDARIAPAGDGHLPPQAEAYMAVPLVEEVGAGPGIIPQGELLSWFLVYRYQEAVRYRSDLIAVQLGARSTSMLPTLAPGDIVLVDRQDKNIDQPGHIMLVMDAEGAGKIKRVTRFKERNDTRILYYSDNAAENPPEQYSLREDFEGDINRAVVGRVVWAWSDVSGK